jgi:hypothetical protein
MGVPLSVAIPVELITLLPSGDGVASELELRIAVMDEDGNLSAIPAVMLRLSSDQAPNEDGFVRYDTSFKLRKKKHDVVVSVFDSATGRLATNRFEIAP